MRLQVSVLSLAIVADYLALARQFIIPILSPELCNSNDTQTVSALEYEYNGQVVGFANATRYIQFASNFKVVCLENVNDRYLFVIEFDHLQTKMKTNVSKTARRTKIPMARHRQRKIPGIFISTSKASPVVQLTSEQQINEDRWFPLSTRPMFFYQFSNGTISDIFIDRSDSERKSEDEHIKKGIAFLFQTWRGVFSQRIAYETLENDDLGQHFSQFKVESLAENDSISLIKTIQPEDFVSFQFDSVNYNQIKLSLTQRQRLNSNSGVVEFVEGRISTDSTVASEALPLGVVVSYSMKLKKITAQQKDRFELEFDARNFIRSSKNNFTKQRFDGSKYLLEIYHKKSSWLQNVSFATLLASVWNDPDRPAEDLLKIKSLLSLESQLYNSKKLQELRWTLDIVPEVLKHFENAKRSNLWKVGLRFLDLIIGCSNTGLENVIYKVLESDELTKYSKYAHRFFSTIGQIAFPNDRLLRSLINLVNDSRPVIGSIRSLNSHIIFTVGTLVAKPNSAISNETKDYVMYFFSQHLIPFARECDMPDVGRGAILEALAEAIRPNMLVQVEESTRHVIGVVLQLAQKCYLYEPTLAAETLLSLRYVLEDHQVQQGLLLLLRRASCQTRLALVRQLIVIPDSSFQLKMTRTWPKHGFTAIDNYLYRALENGNKGGDFWCNRDVLRAYFAMKHPASMKLVVKRQTSTLDGSGLDKLASSSQTGSLDSLPISSDFNPEMNCKNWDSQVGARFSQVYSDVGRFDRDSLLFGHEKRHCLFNGSLKFGPLGDADFKAGFFSGRSNSSNARLFGKTWLGGPLGFDVAGVSFSREIHNGHFNGEMKLDAMGTNYVTDYQYTCNGTVDHWNIQEVSNTQPAMRLVFFGFVFVMHVDYRIGVNLTFWPSPCGSDGSMGVRFMPMVHFEADAYAELENDYFGVGIATSFNVNYHMDLMTQVPSGCFYLHYGHDQMSFKFDFYLKLPAIVFPKPDLAPILVKQPHGIRTRQFVIKKSSHHVIYGFCQPNTVSKGGDAKWELDTDNDTI